MIYRSLSPAETEDIKSRILYEDNHILIFSKESGEITQGDKTGDEPLPEKLKAYIAARDSKPGQVFMGVPHRLDRPVSGAVVFAKTSKALERLTAMFREGKVHKTYWALTCEAPAKEADQLRDYLVRNESSNKSFIVRDPSGKAGAKEAILRYRHIADTERYHLLEIELLTGRHHQIRCQLAGAGMHIKGDLKYGAPRSNRNGGICLLARKVTFLHPVKGVHIEASAPIPSDWPPIQFPA